MIHPFTFDRAVWLFCPAFVLHVLEEWPRFAAWARRYASARFTSREYIRIHTAGIAVSMVAPAIVSRFPDPPVIFIFFSFVFLPAVLMNAFFHIGASFVTRTYCPGVLTACAIYLPLFAIVTTLAHQEHILTAATFGLSCAISAGFHFWEVGHNVFKAW